MLVTEVYLTERTGDLKVTEGKNEWTGERRGRERGREVYQ